MDILGRFDEAAQTFWQAWVRLDDGEKKQLRGTQLQRRAFMGAFNVKQELQKHLSTGPVQHRVYCKNPVPEHALEDSTGSESDEIA